MFILNKTSFFLIVHLSLAQFLSFGQDSLNIKNRNKKLGITLQINNPVMDELSVNWYNIPGESIDDHNLKHSSFSLGTVIKYNLNGGATIRLRTGLTKIAIREYNFDLNDNSDVVRTGEEAKGKQIKIHVSPGLTWRLDKTKLNFYSGFELPINIHGEFLHNFIKTESSSTTGEQYNKRIEQITLPKGYSFGLAAIFGFSYSPVPTISFGAEFAPALLYAQLSGKTTTILSYEDYKSPIINKTTSNSQDKNKGFTFQENRFSLDFSFWFGNHY